MVIQRTIPPTAAPLGLKQLLYGLTGLFCARSYLEKLETELRQYFNVKHVFLLSSGKAALTMALYALKSLTPKQDEVIVPAYTCYSVPSAIMKAGLKVSLCDIDPSTFDFDYDLLEKTINSNTLCVIPTHFFGIPADVDKIEKLRKKSAFFILEDAAQAMGGVYNNRKLGTMGDIGIFSFGRGKNITCGSGGLIVTDSDEIAAALENEYSVLEEPLKIECIFEYIKLIAFALFIHPSLYWFPSGLPFLKLGETLFQKDFAVAKLSGMHAAVLSGWRRRLEQSNHTRRQNADCLRGALDIEIAKDRSVNFLRLPFTAHDSRSRDEIISLSITKGLGIGRMYPSPINEIEDLKSSFARQSYPAAKWLSERLLTIPTHHLLTGRDKENIVSGLSAIGFRQSGSLRTARADD
jgi:perosamine synthetase